MEPDTECSTHPETNEPMWYWVSRNRAPTGELMDYCDLWYVRPIWHVSEAGAIWDTRDVTPEGSQQHYGWYGRYTLKAVLEWCRVLPDTDRELLVVGRRA